MLELTSKWVPLLLLGIVLFQGAFIVYLAIKSDITQGQIKDSGALAPECVSHAHSIQKRATGSGAPFCLPGCVRRRIQRRTTTPRTQSQSQEWSWTGYDTFNAIQGARGPSGARGAPGLPGPRGSAGTPGRRGSAGSPGVVGWSGSAGLQGASGARGIPGGRGPAESPGGGGSPGMPGESGARGQAGGQGVRGTPGGYYTRTSYGPQQDSSSGGWPSPRGDQVIRGGEEEQPDEDEMRRKKQLTQVLNDLRLYDHPKCVTALDHAQVVSKLKDEGKASFMIMVDLAKSVYCIVHA